MTDAQTTNQMAAGAGAPHLTAEEFAAAVKNSTGKPVMVDFYADWCGPCKAAAPIIDKLAGEYADTITIAKLDVDEHNAVAAQYGVMSIPTVLMFKDGQEVDRKVGFPGESGYRQMLAKVAPAA